MDFLAVTWCCLRLVPVNNRQTKRPKKKIFPLQKDKQEGCKEGEPLAARSSRASQHHSQCPLASSSISRRQVFPLSLLLLSPFALSWQRGLVCKGLPVPPGSFPHTSSRNLYRDPWLLSANHEIMWMPPRQLVNPQQGAARPAWRRAGALGTAARAGHGSDKHRL